MRGKKAHPEFISQFISKCIEQGITTPEEMLAAAKYDIQNIDDKIKEVEVLKTVRSKLLDVIAIFNQPESKIQEAQLLPFFKLQHPQTCRKLCKYILAVAPDYAYSIMGIKDPEVLFCIKQLIETKIINRIENHIVRGERFDEYMKFVFREIE